MSNPVAAAEGPPLERLLRRLAETPALFLAEPRIGRVGEVLTAAVVHDVLDDLGARPTTAELAPFLGHDPRARPWLRLVLVACWLARDDWFLGRPGVGAAVRAWLARLDELARLVDAEQFVTDPERREELARSLLAGLGLTPKGETRSQAEDRLLTVDSMARARVVEQMRVKRERAEQLRREMEAQRAREAAARYSRE